ncbi:hypothetical protein TNCV_2924901 [Trichonephila clavipes]|nr:hypothetical protein TNCV_2924901 [Trichonephila clavipes]
MYIVTFVTPFDKLQKPLQEKFRAFHTEEAFKGLLDFSIASKAPSGKILLQNQTQMKVTWCEIIWADGVGVPNQELQYGFALPSPSVASPLSSNNRMPVLRNPGHFSRITSFNLDQGVTIPLRHCDTLVTTSKKSAQK